MFRSLYRVTNIQTYKAVCTRKKYSTEVFRPIYDNFFKYSNNIAVIDSVGCYKYRDILYSSYLIAKRIRFVLTFNQKTCDRERISFLCPNDATYVCVLLACWITGNVAVPLSSNHPASLLEYFIKNSQSSLVIAHSLLSDSVQHITSKLNIHFFAIDKIGKDAPKNCTEFQQSEFFRWDSDLSKREALIIYTSGSTGMPKGVVLTHGNLHAQISSLIEAWEIRFEDSILHTLPLYHMHGIMNALLCILSVGGIVVMRPKFIASEVWSYLTNQSNTYPKVNLFYGVPTMYVKLIEELKKVPGNKNYIRACCEKNIRLMTSGSAALPEPVFFEWTAITGHSLLERYGMSEIGMALSNPLKGLRLPGHVGKPLPGVKVKVVDDSSINSSFLVKASHSQTELSPYSEGKSGELLIKGPTVFKEYWNNKKATIEAFTNCGWFKTGDTATFENGSFKILGRASVDIIKSGGYKISSLQVESCLLLHPYIKDCAVFGIPDEKYGERITALLVTEDKELSSLDIKEWCKNHLPSYAVPTLIKYVDSIPRNIMGKVNKKELKISFM